MWVDQCLGTALYWTSIPLMINPYCKDPHEGSWVMTHKYRGSIVVLSISKSVEPNEEQKEMISGFQQGILCKY